MDRKELIKQKLATLFSLYLDIYPGNENSRILNTPTPGASDYSNLMSLMVSYKKFSTISKKQLEKCNELWKLLNSDRRKK